MAEVAKAYAIEACKEQKKMVATALYPNNICHHCYVPQDLHGTCCGWRNAKTPINTAGVIVDQRHPFFGKTLNDWSHHNYIELRGIVIDNDYVKSKCYEE